MPTKFIKCLKELTFECVSTFGSDMFSVDDSFIKSEFAGRKLAGFGAFCSHGC